MKKRLVLIESPFMGDVARNVRYTRACLRDCLVDHNEFPFASHLFYTQTGVLDDNNPHERELGIEAGLMWAALAEATIVYTDLGISRGMKYGIKKAEKVGRVIEYRHLGENWEEMQRLLLERTPNHPFVLNDVRM